MVHLAYASAAPAPRSSLAKVIAWVYAAVVTIMAVTQMFAFEDFMPLLANYRLPGGYGTAVLCGCLIVLVEVFALPFLLRMPLSLLFRWCSAACAVAVPAFWLWLTLMMPTGNSGLLGSKITVQAGITQLLATFVLAILAAWSVWGLWPFRNKR